MKIEKAATSPVAFRRPLVYTPNCRSAIELFLRTVGAVDGAPVLVPAYIGWSPREGSGIHDPILAAGARLEFYRVGRDLAIDLSHLRSQLEKVRPRVVLFVHYFGFPDPRLAEAVALCRDHDALVLEDEAHALLSDLVGGICGRFGDAAVFSLHKMLPFTSGGAIAWKAHSEPLPPAPLPSQRAGEGAATAISAYTPLVCRHHSVFLHF